MRNNLTLDFSALRRLFVAFLRAAKKQKVREQYASETPNSSSSIFNGIVVWINGLTNPPASELRALIYANGGTVEYTLDTRVTHVVASNLPTTKVCARLQLESRAKRACRSKNTRSRSIPRRSCCRHGSPRVRA